MKYNHYYCSYYLEWSENTAKAKRSCGGEDEQYLRKHNHWWKKKSAADLNKED